MQPGIDGTPPVSAEGDQLTVCVLASGSRGNATYISDGRHAILIDAGLSGIQIQRRMAARGLDPESLDALLVTHEHADHIHGVGVLSRRFHLPVHINAATLQASSKTLGRLTEVHPFVCGRAFSVGAMTIHPFTVSHDAEDPAGFTVTCDQRKVGLATDLGLATGMVKSHLAGCDLLILEANHDPKMLIDGPYPWPLKQRIQGRSGHLSNEDAAGLLAEVGHDQLAHVVLAHLSEENNTAQKARQAIEPVVNGADTRLHVATQAEGSEPLTLPFG